MLSLKEQLGVTPSLWFMTNCWISNSVDGWCPCSDTFINTYTLSRIQIHFFPTVQENPVLSVNCFDDFEFHTFDFQLLRQDHWCDSVVQLMFSVALFCSIPQK